MNIKNLSDILVEKNIRPSYQRLKIYEYLISNKNHPTVDDIYNNLLIQIPTLSKTTIYTTLDLFIEKDLVHRILFDKKEFRYDANYNHNAHFKCKKCSNLYDIDIDTSIASDKNLKGYETHDIQINLTGICENCIANMT